MPAACFETQPDGQAKAFQAPLDSALGPGCCPCALASVYPVVALYSPLHSCCYLHWPDTLAPVDLAELGEDWAPKKWGVHAGPRPLAHPQRGQDYK